MERALQVCLEMFEQRGYQNISHDDSKIDAIKPDGRPVCAFMVDTSKFNVNRVQEYIAFMNELDIHHGVIVYKDNVTPMAKKIVDSSQDIMIELFMEEELQYNITKHRLVPKHERLSDEEAINFKTRFGLNFPTLLRSDPISRFYGYNKGDVIKITRNDSIIYRIVKN
jgi:DNA-directed RNA polymerases I, II, and III subunit RPABC1